MKKFLFSVAGLAALLLFSCSKDNGSATLIADFTMTPNPASAGQEVTFTPSVTGGEAPMRDVHIPSRQTGPTV